jgi:rhamnosyltransferase
MKIFAIVVLYNPDVKSLLINLTNLGKQVDGIVIIDNSSISIEPTILESLNIKSYISNNNLGGIAGAQNKGILEAIKNNCDFVLLMDQDSFPQIDMVSELIFSYEQLMELGIKIAAVGPKVVNSFTKIPYESRIRKKEKYIVVDRLSLVNALISSGTLIKVEVFETIGFFNEKLFIDGVDHEWCWRALSKGYNCILSHDAILEHNLGEGDRKLLGISISISSPFRIYYQYRNYIYLCRFNYVPLYWKFANFIKYLVKFFYYPAIISPRYLGRILKGIKDGLLM